MVAKVRLIPSGIKDEVDVINANRLKREVFIPYKKFPTPSEMSQPSNETPNKNYFDLG